MVHTCYLARTHIQSMRIYINEKKLPLSAIVEQEAPDLAITGNFYGPSWVPVCPLKADGQVLECDPEYAYPALCWDKGPDVGVEIVPKGGMSPQRNYIANCAGIYAGQDQPSSMVAMWAAAGAAPAGGCGMGTWLCWPSPMVPTV